MMNFCKGLVEWIKDDPPRSLALIGVGAMVTLIVLWMIR